MMAAAISLTNQLQTETICELSEKSFTEQRRGVDGMMAEINHQYHQDDADQDINDNYLVNYHECTVHIHET